MSTLFKILLVILIIIVIIAIVIFVKGKNAYDKITFTKPTLKQDIQALAAANLSGNTLSLPLPFIIKNDNNFSILFSSVNAELLYNGNVIGKSNDAGWHTIPANGSLSLAPVIDFSINDAVKNLFIQKIQGGHPAIDYVITMKVFGIPIPSIKDNFIW